MTLNIYVLTMYYMPIFPDELIELLKDNYL
jgi:hypothetical protein